MFGYGSSKPNQSYPCFTCGKRTFQTYHGMRIPFGSDDAIVQLRCAACQGLVDYWVPTEIVDGGEEGVYAYLTREQAKLDAKNRAKKQAQLVKKNVRIP